MQNQNANLKFSFIFINQVKIVPYLEEYHMLAWYTVILKS